MRRSTILASFAALEDAQTAKLALAEKGIHLTQLDRIGRHPTKRHSLDDTAYPTSLTGIADIDRRTLAAADTNYGGWESGDFDLVGGQDVLLTVVVEDERRKLAERILREHGADL